MDIGLTLRQARENRGLTLEDVEEQIKIRKKYLEALENEQFDVLPGHVYVRGFIRSYARHLDLDSAELVSRYEAGITGKDALETQETALEEHKPAGGLPFRRWAGVLAVVAVALMLVFATSVLRGEHDPAVPDRQQAGQHDRQESGNGDLAGRTEGENGPGPGTAEPGLPQVSPGLKLNLNVRDRDSWMQVVVDDQVAFEGYVRAGNSKSFQGERNIRLWLGNAGAVQVQLNGENLGYLGEVGQVVREEFNSADPAESGRSS